MHKDGNENPPDNLPQEVEKVTSQQKADVPSTSTQPLLDEPLRAKVRYLGGVCISTLSKMLQQKMKEKSMQRNLNVLNLQRNLCVCLRKLEASTLANSEDQESLREVQRKQGQ